MGKLLGLLVLVWLLIGVLAAWQRGYFENSDMNCANAGTIALTVVAGPLNYVERESEGHGLPTAATESVI